MKIAHGTLVMAVDGSKLLIFRNEGDAREPLLKAVAHEQAENPRTSLQGTDRPGRSFASASPRRSGVGNTDWHGLGETQFAIESVRTLEEIQKDMDAKVILMAGPRILGDIRKHLSEQMKHQIIAQIDKDVVNHASDDIVKLVSAYEP